MKTNYKLTDQNKIAVVELFRNGIRVCDIAKEFNVTSPAISALLRRRKIVTRGTRIDHFNENVFDQIDTEEKAYWLGFIIADGNVHANTLNIELHSKDAGHLEKYKTFLESSRDLEYRKTKPAVRFRVNSSYLVQSLAQYGVVPAKSRSIFIPAIPSNLMHHLLRGYWDGDGWITLRPKRLKSNGKLRSNSHWLWGTASLSKEMLDGFTQWLIKNGIISTLCKRKLSGCWQLAVEGQQVSQLMEILYADSSVYLDRKYEMFMQTKVPLPFKLPTKDELGRWS